MNQTKSGISTKTTSVAQYRCVRVEMIELRKAKRYRLIRGPLRQKPPSITERERGQ